MLFRRTAAFCAAFLIATAMTGCGSLPFIGNNSADTDTASSEAEDVREDAEETAGAAGTAVPDLTLKIDSTDGKMSLTVPENWEDLSGRFASMRIDGQGGSSGLSVEEACPLKAGSYDEAAFLMGAWETKEGSHLADLKDYTDTLYKAVSGNDAFSDVRPGQYLEMTLPQNGLTAYRRDFTAVFDGLPVSYWIYAVDGGDAYYQLTAWTTGTNARTLEPCFDAIARTFTIS